MALGGETVGEAYIRIHANGSNLPREIKDEFRRAEPQIEHEGARAHESYRKGFDEESKKKPSGRQLVRELRGSKGRMDAVGSALGSSFGNKLRDEIIRSVKSEELGDRIFKNMAARARASGSFKPIKQAIKNLGREVDLATRQILAQEATLRQQAERDSARLARLAARDSAARLAQLRQDEKAITGLFQRRFNALAKMSTSFARDDRRRNERTFHDLATAARGGDAAAAAALHALRRSAVDDLDAIEKGFVRLNGRTREGLRPITDLERTILRLRNRTEGALGGIGRAFGKGSRNNFFNAIGSFVEGAAHLIERSTFGLLVKVSHGIGNVIAAAKDGPKALGDLFIKTLGQGLIKLVSIAGAAGAALSLLQAIAGPLVATIANLGGAVVALAATLSFGLVGAIGALLPVMGVAVIGVAALGLAFGGLNKAQKDVLKARLGPVVDDFRKLRDVTRNALFSDLSKQVPQLHKLMQGELIPLFTTVGRSIAKAATGFLTALNGKAFHANLESLRKFAPTVFRDLGKAGTNAFGALTSVMRAAVPIATRFLETLVKASNALFKRESSAAGQKRLLNFFDKAYADARLVYRTFKDLGKVVRDLFTLGRGAGDSLFGSINSSLERFDRYLRSTKGRAATLHFFDKVVTFFSDLGKFSSGVGKLFSSLNSAFSSKEAGGILKSAGALFKIIADALPAATAFNKVFFGAIGEVGKALVQILKPLAPLLKDIAGDVGAGAVAIIKGIGAAVKAVAGPLTALTTFVGKHADLFKPLILAFISFKLAMAGFTVFSTIQAMLVTRFAAINGAIRTGAANIRANGARAAAALAGVATGLGIAMAGQQAGNKSGTDKAIGIGTGVLGGALAGASIGSFLPGPGTAVGGIVGGLAGGLFGVINAFKDTGKAGTAAGKQITAAMLEAKQTVDDLTTSILTDSNALGANVKASVIAQLQKKGAFGQGDQLGLSEGLITKSALGDAGATSKLNSALFSALSGPHRDQAIALAKSLGLVADELGKASAAADQNARANGKNKLSLRSVADQLKRNGGANATYAHSLDPVNVVGQANIQFIRAHIAALDKDAASQLKHGTSAKVVAANLDKGTDALRRQLIQAHFLPGSIDAIIAKYQHVPGLKLTKLRVKDEGSPTITTFKNYLEKVHGKTITVYAATKKAADDIASLIASFNGQTITLNVHPRSGTVASAAGRVVNGPITSLIGEAGPEAVVPLRRPLAMVDKSVRALSAFAQGIPLNGQTPRMASGGVAVSGGSDFSKHVTVMPGAITLVTPTADPVAAAQEFLNRLVSTLS